MLAMAVARKKVQFGCAEVYEVLANPQAVICQMGSKSDWLRLAWQGLHLALQ
jgi:hypothetical protein